ncbi:uncharacterized protein PFL1_03567 [Pseudozyma flocculosa PF-1]|uniref:Adenylate cyclase n=2 Tax=Pseudozyma flocculosa TaxID=84751 RepID=A0A5C3F4Q4_9BASI|nr:uncharacterized protein PFL1_03567 [Pseudozyma flocculosa PF-1]EPQ28764.1 hypothetical protein PFL1_03567 [Pseudozyma flocculosa PF-1]SPO39458.1 uncharacterized protein PSFLO_04939 [Pseudozyma flocculosa]
MSNVPDSGSIDAPQPSSEPEEQQQQQQSHEEPGTHSPRASTPLGPHPQSPPKKPPSPIPAETSATSFVDHGAADAATETSSATEPNSSPPLGAVRQDSSLQGLGINLDTGAPASTASITTPAGSLESGNAEEHGDDAGADRAAKDEADARKAAIQPAVASSVPDWMTDELDESWREASQSNSLSNAAAINEGPATQSANTDLPVAAPGPTSAALQEQATATIPTLGSVRLPTSGLGSRSVSTVGGFFDARESLGRSGMRSSALLQGDSAGYRRSRLGMERSLTDTELQAGPSTPSKRVPSHAVRRTVRTGEDQEGDDDDNSGGGDRGAHGGTEDRAGSRSPSSAPEDFESARGSLIERSRRHAETSASDDGRGTFIHRADVSSLPPILRPAWQKAQDRDGDPHSPKKKGGMSAIGGDMFTPMKLQTMFRTPTPPQRPPMTTTSDHAPDETPRPRDDIERTPRMKGGALADDDRAPPAQITPAPQAGETSGRTGLEAKLPSAAFTFRTPQAGTALSATPRLDPATPAAAVPGQPRAARASARPASAAAAFVHGGTSPLPPVASHQMLSAPSTPHTPMRLFKFNYEDVATRARLEMLVNRNGTSAGDTMGGGETERERKRLRLDVKPRKVISGDLMAMRSDALPTATLPSSPEAGKATRDGRPSAVDVPQSDPKVLRATGTGSSRAEKPAVQPAAIQPAMPSPSKSVLLPPIVDYVKEAPVYMSALQQQMVRSVSDITASSRAWVTDEDNGGGASGSSGGNDESDRDLSAEHDARLALHRHADDRQELLPFHQGSVQVISPLRETRSPNRRWRQRRSAVRHARDADATEDISSTTRSLASRSPSGSPLRLSTRRLPQNSSFNQASIRGGEDGNDGVDEASMPPMSSTVRSRKSWVSASQAVNGLRKEESPRKLLRRYSAAAQAEEEVMDEGEDRLFLHYRDTALGGSSGPDPNRHWSDESFQRELKIKELEEKLARRAAEKRRADRSESRSWSRESEAVAAGASEGQRPFSRPQYITLHEPTLEDANNVPDDRGVRVRRSDEHHDDQSDTWEDDPAEAAEAGATRRVQDGIVLYDSERVSMSEPAAPPTRTLRSVVSEAQLRPSADAYGVRRGYQTWQEAGPSRQEWQERAQPSLQPQRHRQQHSVDFAGPRHPSTASVGAKPNFASSSRYLSSGYGDDEGCRGERTVSSNTLVDDRNRESYDSRVNLNASIRSTLALGADPSAIVNSLGGATITRKGSMLNISQIPDEEVEQLGGENLRYDRERNRWIKVSKKPSSESLRGQASAVATESANDLGDTARGRGSAFGRRSTTRTPVEPMIPEASIETSQAGMLQETSSGAQSRAQARSGQHGNPAVLPSAGFTSAAVENSIAQDGRLSDSSDPFKDFESFGQSTTAADHSVAEARPQSKADSTAEDRHASTAPDPSAGMRQQPPIEKTVRKPTQRPNLTPAASQPALPTYSTPLASQARVVSGPPAFHSVQRPINTMPRAQSALRNVVTYSPDVTMRSSGSATTAEGGTVEVRAPEASSAQERDAVQTQRQVQPPADAQHEARQSRAGDLAAAPPTTRAQRTERNLAERNLTEAAGRHDLHPATPERRNTAPAASYLTPPRSILKPSPSSHTAAGQNSRSGDLYRASPNPASANRTISFAEAHTLHRYEGPQSARHHRDNQLAAATDADASDLSQSMDVDWSEEADDDDDDDRTARQGAYGRERWTAPQAADGPTSTMNRTDAISRALQQLADLTLQSEAGPKPAAKPYNAGTPSTKRRIPSHTAAGDAADGRSPWSYAALRRPRKVRDPYRYDDDEDGEAVDDTYDELRGYPDMTLLTDASFNVAHDKILEVITDVEPWEPGWEQLQAIDMSGRRVESCLRLKEFLPSLEEVKLDRNELAYLTGLPPSVRNLSISRNRITQLASFGQLLNLERLDISHNQIETLSHLECLKHLHTLIADHVHVSSLDGINRLPGLVHLSLSGNLLRGVNLERTAWRDLETLNLSHNALITVRGLGTLRRLRSLNLDHNRLSRVDLEPSMPKLRAMRISGNPSLTSLDVLPARKLRTLYADYCALDSIQNLESLTRLDNLSMRQQVEARVVWPARHLRDTRRLFFSGNAFPQGLDFEALPSAASATSPPELQLRRQPAPMVRFLNLVYLELAACQLTALPVELPELAPNLRSLNLDHNLISTLPPLAGMQRLKRLSVVGCRIKKSKSIIKAIRGLDELQVIDTRTNPCTLGLYPPLMIPAGALDPARPGGQGYSSPSVAAAHLPPVPSPAVVQPDRARHDAKRAESDRRAAERQAEKSYFHKRQPPLVDPALYDDDDEDGEDRGYGYDDDDDRISAAGGHGETKVDERGRAVTQPSVTALFLAADQRFYGTLPAGFQEKRALHRGLMAMSCARLSWVDGLFIEEEEVLRAEEIVYAQQRGQAEGR